MSRVGRIKHNAHLAAVGATAAQGGVGILAVDATIDGVGNYRVLWIYVDDILRLVSVPRIFLFARTTKVEVTRLLIKSQLIVALTLMYLRVAMLLLGTYLGPIQGYTYLGPQLMGPGTHRNGQVNLHDCYI